VSLFEVARLLSTSVPELLEVAEDFGLAQAVYEVDDDERFAPAEDGRSTSRSFGTPTHDRAVGRPPWAAVLSELAQVPASVRQRAEDLAFGEAIRQDPHLGDESKGCVGIRSVTRFGLETIVSGC